MNKLEYEMNEVAKRAAEKAIKEAKIVDAKKFIGYAKNHGTNLENTIQKQWICMMKFLIVMKSLN